MSALLNTANKISLDLYRVSSENGCKRGENIDLVMSCSVASDRVLSWFSVSAVLGVPFEWRLLVDGLSGGGLLW